MTVRWGDDRPIYDHETPYPERERWDGRLRRETSQTCEHIERALWGKRLEMTLLDIREERMAVPIRHPLPVIVPVEVIRRTLTRQQLGMVCFIFGMWTTAVLVALWVAVRG